MSDLLEVGATPMAEDRRRSLRYACGLGIAIEWGAAVLAGTVREISAEGMFVEIDGPLWVGARFVAQLELNEPVAVDCSVRRVEPHRGMALTYTPSQESGREAIKGFLNRLAEP